MLYNNMLTLTCMRVPGNVRVPSFAEENKRSGKGVQFGNRLPDPKLKFITPAPGGNVKVPSFALENKHGGKGVPFGRRTKSWKEIERRLGYPEPPAPGGTHPPTRAVPSRSHGRTGC